MERKTNALVTTLDTSGLKEHLRATELEKLRTMLRPLAQDRDNPNIYDDAWVHKTAQYFYRAMKEQDGKTHEEGSSRYVFYASRMESEMGLLACLMGVTPDTFARYRDEIRDAQDMLSAAKNFNEKFAQFHGQEEGDE